jgi:uncharacterized membrane-anchored protein YhcB (DUF1043 family)
MAYRNITRDDFNQVLQSLGNDPAILTDEIGPDHLRTANTAPWYTNLYRNWMESNPLKEKWSNQAAPTPILMIFIFLLALAGGLTYIAIQIQELDSREMRTSDLATVQKQLGQIQDELHELDERLEEQFESIFIQLNEMQSKYQSLARSAHISAPSKPDPTEAELKKWRHLGVGLNKNGAYALLHDGQQALMLSKNQITKGSWRLAEFNSAEAILVGPNEKRIVLRIQ